MCKVQLTVYQQYISTTKMCDNSENSPVIGIDLGTTYCCVGYMNLKTRQVQIIKNKNGNRITPSYVQFTPREEVIGDYAKRKVPRDWRNVVYDSKRLIGQRFDNKDVQRNIKHNWKFEVVRGDNDTPLIKIPRYEKPFKPEDISAKLLKYMKDIAEDSLGTTVKDAVITVPAYFNYHQRTATIEAGKLAGLNVISIMNEPTAAILAYMHDTEISDKQNVLVFDLGGGTFDVSIASLQGKMVTVKATAGNTYLGGRDFDNNLAKFIEGKIDINKHQVNEDEKEVMMRRIQSQSETVKKLLSGQTETQFQLSSFSEEIDMEIIITREDFNRVNEDLFQNCIDIVKNCLEDASMKANQIDKVILIGGSTRIPKLQELLKQYFGRQDLTKHIDPDEAVAYGAAIHATQYKQTDYAISIYKFTDVTPLSLGIRTHGGKVDIIIPRNSTIPVTRCKNYITGSVNQSGMSFCIYEGERALTQHNNKIGKSILSFPPKAPGYNVDIIFHVNSNGILKLEAKTDDGTYSSLEIQYEMNHLKTVTEMLRNAKLHSQKDEKISALTEKWSELHRYCTKMKAMCTYNKKDIDRKNKDAMERACDEVMSWLEDNYVVAGSKTEKNAISLKMDKIKGICEPIAELYGFKDVSAMTLTNFHTYITN